MWIYNDILPHYICTFLFQNRMIIIRFMHVFLVSYVRILLGWRVELGKCGRDGGVMDQDLAFQNKVSLQYRVPKIRRRFILHIISLKPTCQHVFAGGKRFINVWNNCMSKYCKNIKKRIYSGPRRAIHYYLRQAINRNSR